MTRKNLIKTEKNRNKTKEYKKEMQKNGF